MLDRIFPERNRSRFTPEGWHTVTPRIVVRDAEGLVEFLMRVFGATGNYRPDLPSVVKIGDSIIMISNAGIRNSMPAFLYVYVDDADKTTGGPWKRVQVHWKSRRTCPMATVAVW